MVVVLVPLLVATVAAAEPWTAQPLTSTSTAAALPDDAVSSTVAKHDPTETISSCEPPACILPDVPIASDPPTPPAPPPPEVPGPVDEGIDDADMNLEIRAEEGLLDG